MASSKNMIVLRSSDGEMFELEETVAVESQTIKHMIEDDCANNVIPIPNVTSKVLAKVIKYCRRHVDAAIDSSEDGSTSTDIDFEEEASSNAEPSTDSEEEASTDAEPLTDSEEEASSDGSLKAFDKEFLKVDQDMLFDLILASNYLNIKSLFELTCQTVADMMTGKTPDEIRKIFNIKNDYTPAEEAEVRRENAWAF